RKLLQFVNGRFDPEHDTLGELAAPARWAAAQRVLMASTDLPRMQHQPRSRASAELSRAVAPEPAPTRGKPKMMRQSELVERVRKYNPNTNEELLNRAYVYAMKAHGEQLRASGDPYFTHPLEVAAILTDLKLDDATIVAALLHDTIEDTDSTRGEI